MEFIAPIHEMLEMAQKRGLTIDGLVKRLAYASKDSIAVVSYAIELEQAVCSLPLAKQHFISPAFSQFVLFSLVVGKTPEYWQNRYAEHRLNVQRAKAAESN